MLAAQAAQLVQAGDAVLLKASLSTNMRKVVDLQELGHRPRTTRNLTMLWPQRRLDGGDFFNLFRYITFRRGCSFIALFFGFILAVTDRRFARKQGKGQPIRDDGPRVIFYRDANNGVLMILPLMTATLLWARLDNVFVWVVLLVTVSFGLIDQTIMQRSVNKTPRAFQGKCALV